MLYIERKHDRYTETIETTSQNSDFGETYYTKSRNFLIFLIPESPQETTVSLELLNEFLPNKKTTQPANIRISNSINIIFVK